MLLKPETERVRRRARRLLVLMSAVTAGAFGVACSGLLGVDLEGLRPQDDAMPRADDADAVVATDATSEAPATPPTFCDMVTPTPYFCADFDRGELKDEWNNKLRTPDLGETGGGVIEGDLLAFASPPRSASLRTPALVDPSVVASGVLVRFLPDIPSAGLTLTFDVRIDSERHVENDSIPIVSLAFEGSTEIVSLLRGASGMYFASKHSVAKVEGGLIPVGTWTTVEIQVRRPTDADGGAAPADDADTDSGTDAGTAGGIAILRINVKNAAFVALGPSVSGVADAQLWLGPMADGPAFPFAMHVDNVRVRYDPFL